MKGSRCIHNDNTETKDIVKCRFVLPVKDKINEQSASQIRYCQVSLIKNTDLVDVRADDEDGRLGCVYGDGVEPEVEAGVFMAEADVPQKQVQRPVRQEKLQTKRVTINSRRRGNNSLLLYECATNLAS